MACMVKHFDHLVIAVRDLAAAIELYQRLGFDVRLGGQHTGLGTHNALIRFGLDYVELLSLYEQPSQSGLRGDVLREFLQHHEGGLLGYALATDTIEQDAQHLSTVELLANGPFAMHRLRPNGTVLSWRLLVPGGVAWRQPWPFFIQWDASDEQRLAWEQPGAHANGVTGWQRIAIAVRDLSGAIDLYQRQLGLQQQGSIGVARLGAQGAVFQVGTARIELLAPNGPGVVQDTLAYVGEGPVEVSFTVKDLDAARRLLTEAGCKMVFAAAGPGTLLIAPQETLGVRIILEQYISRDNA
jgi:catechol 2,3-dioxygenase-like lactoylglutathione lyase family enzyme